MGPNDVRGLNRLLAVAIVDCRFRTLLLTCTAAAVEIEDYDLETVRLTPRGKKLALAVQAASLVDLAQSIRRELT